jgi:hypothetical protein
VVTPVVETIAVPSV